jgi:hypothetical protein
VAAEASSRWWGSGGGVLDLLRSGSSQGCGGVAPVEKGQGQDGGGRGAWSVAVMALVGGSKGLGGSFCKRTADVQRPEGLTMGPLTTTSANTLLTLPSDRRCTSQLSSLFSYHIIRIPEYGD